MALINCTECKKLISSKVELCPHCGFPIIDEIVQHQKVEITSLHIAKMNTRKKKIVIVLASVLIMIAVFVFGYIDYSSNVANPKNVIVYTTNTGSKYHLNKCSYLRQSKIQIRLFDVGMLTPCSRCHPPVLKE